MYWSYFEHHQCYISSWYEITTLFHRQSEAEPQEHDHDHEGTNELPAAAETDNNIQLSTVQDVSAMLSPFKVFQDCANVLDNAPSSRSSPSNHRTERKRP